MSCEYNRFLVICAPFCSFLIVPNAQSSQSEREYVVRKFRYRPPQPTASNIAQAQLHIFIQFYCVVSSQPSPIMLSNIMEYVIDDATMQTHLVCAPVRNFTLKGTKFGIFKYTDCCHEDSDVKIKVGNKVLRSHKACLRKISPVFAAMLNADNKDTIDIVDFDIKTVRETVSLMFQHDATPQFNPTPEREYDMIHFAKKYELYGYGCLVSYLTTEDTVIPLLRDLYLTDKIVKNILPKTVVDDDLDYEKIARTPEFQELDEAIKSDFLKQCGIEVASLKAKQNDAKYRESFHKPLILIALYNVFKSLLDEFEILRYHNLLGSALLFFGLFAILCIKDMVMTKK
uniref:BTB domain-containing protein n=1 Tax=Panagrellus redivivus TaxID=6233 RepID=A0A7E4VR57_PANRE